MDSGMDSGMDLEWSGIGNGMEMEIEWIGNGNGLGMMNGALLLDIRIEDLDWTRR